MVDENFSGVRSQNKDVASKDQMYLEFFARVKAVYDYICLIFIFLVLYLYNICNF